MIIANPYSYMKIGICQFKDRVAPRYNHSTEIIIVTLNSKNKVREKKMITVGRLQPPGLTQLLANHNIKTLICGGIEEEYQQALKEKNVLLIGNIIGVVDKVLNRFIEGNLHEGDIVR